jgi:hypothetical protein
MFKTEAPVFNCISFYPNLIYKIKGKKMQGHMAFQSNLRDRITSAKSGSEEENRLIYTYGYTSNSFLNIHRFIDKSYSCGVIRTG